MANKIFKILIKIVFIMMLYQMLLTPKAKATTLDDIFSTGDNFISEGKNGSKKDDFVDYAEVRQNISNIGNILTALGVVYAVIIGGILGIQIMWGSIEAQAKAKEMLIPYVIGCIVIFGAFGIWKLAVTIFSQLQ